MRMSLVLAALALLPATARADVTLTATQSTGHIELVASPGAAIGEVVDGTATPVASTTAPDGTTTAAPEWTCQSPRTFIAATAAEHSAPVTVTTPACADRLRVQTSARVALDGDLRVSVRDLWHLAGIAPRICVTPPRGRALCTSAAMPPDQYDTSRVYRAGRTGTWRVRVTFGAADVRRTVRVVRRAASTLPQILATGDSMMGAISGELKRGLPGRAHIIRDYYVGSGLTRPFIVDWARLPVKQVRADHPDATVISLGMADSAPIGGVYCCGPDWIDAYAKRVRRTMRAYGTVVWLNEPFQRDPAHHDSVAAVNAAVAQASRGLAHVRVVDVAALLTPGGVYSDTLGSARVRSDDGTHLTFRGARIVNRRLVVPALADLGVLPDE